ncbi:MAG: citrate synthase [bacterium]|nr:citrate synthase [bacterium]
MSTESITITDNRTGKTYELPIDSGTYSEYGAYVRSAELRQIKVSDKDFGLLGYDPAYFNTASCASAVTFIDGEEGILRYRGYPIDQLAEQSTFLEVAYLLVYGELPTQDQLAAWSEDVNAQTVVDADILKFVDGYRVGSHTMGMLVGVLGGLSAFYDDVRDFETDDARDGHIRRSIGNIATLGSAVHRRSEGLSYVAPDPGLGYCANLLNMLFGKAGEVYKTDPVLERALDVLLILHADHEQNCSASTMRGIGSGGADVYSSMAGAAAALYGPAHGGANEAVLNMLDEIGSVDNVADYIQRVEKKEVVLQGFGHRVYKNYDPRATIIKKTAYEVFEVTGKNPLIDIALELERIALEEEYFVSRNLYPNVDFYSGMIYQAIGLPVKMMTVLFAVGRSCGWLAQWKEMLNDSEQKIARPRQVYTGADERDYVVVGQR